MTYETVNENWKTELYKEIHEVPTQDGLRLIMSRKRHTRSEPLKKPILLIHGLGQNRYSWHLTQRSFENYYAVHGYDVFNLELRGHGLSRANQCPYPERFEEYTDFDIPAAISYIKEHTGHQKLFICGHSLGGCICYIVSARQPEDIAGVVSIGGPVLFGESMRFFRFMARLLKFSHDMTILRFLEGPFTIDWIGKIVNRTLFYFDNPKAMFPYGVWLPESIEREILQERIDKGFDRTSLKVLKLMIRWAAEGVFKSTDEQIDYMENVRQISSPILFVAGDRDDVVPLASIEPGFRLVNSKDKTLICFNRIEHHVSWGHCDLICGKFAPMWTWPTILMWLNER